MKGWPRKSKGSSHCAKFRGNFTRTRRTSWASHFRAGETELLNCVSVVVGRRVVVHVHVHTLACLAMGEYRVRHLAKRYDLATGSSRTHVAKRKLWPRFDSLSLSLCLSLSLRNFANDHLTGILFFFLSVFLGEHSIFHPAPSSSFEVCSIINSGIARCLRHWVRNIGRNNWQDIKWFYFYESTVIRQFQRKGDFFEWFDGSCFFFFFLLSRGFQYNNGILLTEEIESLRGN